jgi:hypothetical protein
MSTEAKKRSIPLAARPSAPAPRRSRRRLALAGAAIAAMVGLSACGNADMRETTGTYAGENGAAAPYLNVGNLVYQVEISRSLNPWEPEDSAFLEGMPDRGKELKQGEEWLGVFLQVYNETKKSQVDASDVTVSDTEGEVYKPIMPNDTNLFAYRPGSVPGKGQIPRPDTAASYNATGGALLIYKIKLEALEDRPLKIKIANPENPSETASAELDL